MSASTYPKAVVKAIRQVYLAMTEVGDSVEALAKTALAVPQVTQAAASAGMSDDEVHTLAARMALDYLPSDEDRYYEAVGAIHDSILALVPDRPIWNLAETVVVSAEEAGISDDAIVALAGRLRQKLQG
jgi:hypothetical protein